MNHDFAFTDISADNYKVRRMGGIAALIGLVALIAGLALAAPEAQAPAAVFEPTVAAPAETPAQPSETRGLPMDCSLVPAEPVDCTYN